MANKHFNPLNAVADVLPLEELQGEMEETGECLSAVIGRHRAVALYARLASMRYRTDGYEDKADGEILDSLLELLMDSVTF